MVKGDRVKLKDYKSEGVIDEIIHKALCVMVVVDGYDFAYPFCARQLESIDTKYN